MWLALEEGYQFTALSSLKAVAKVLEESLAVVMFAAQAFGIDFLFELARVRFLDKGRVKLPKELNNAE